MPFFPLRLRRTLFFLPRTHRLLTPSHLLATRQLTMSPINYNAPEGSIPAGASTDKPSPSPDPKPSASLLLLSPTNKILLMTRPQRLTTTFSGAVVFPGGALDPQDTPPRSTCVNVPDYSYVLCALREAFEECGILLLKDGVVYPDGPHGEWVSTARREVHAGRKKFADVVQEAEAVVGLKGALDVDNVIKFTRWITPPNNARRFDTHMFLYMLPPAADGFGEGGEGTGVRTDSFPSAKGDGGVEVVSTGFFGIEEALGMCERGEIMFFPPQYYLLKVLREFLGEHREGSIQEKRLRLLGYLERSGFGSRVMRPRIVGAPGEDGRAVLGYGKEGGKGKVRVKFTKQGPKGLEIVDLGLEDEGAEGEKAKL